MLWIMLGIVLTLWIIQFGFGLGGLYVPILNVVIWFALLTKLVMSSRSADSKIE